MSLPNETRRKSHDTVSPKKRKRQLVILTILEECGPSSAQEVADELYRSSYTMSNERNLAAPRITELVRLGEVKPVGKKTCNRTKRSVTVWEIVKEVR